MKTLMYADWKNKRVKKIKNIFGEDWFFNKKILDIACSYGEVGIEFLHLGADVTFTDIDKECIEHIKTTSEEMYYKPDAFVLDQNEDYDLKRKFDLVIHFGFLYLVKDWKKNLETVLKHTNIMLLETVVNIDTDSPRNMAMYTEQDIENYLASIGCKFIKLTDPSLNSNGIFGADIKQKHLYDWDPRQFVGYDFNEMFENKTLFVPRRMWLVLK